MIKEYINIKSIYNINKLYHSLKFNKKICSYIYLIKKISNRIFINTIYYLILILVSLKDKELSIKLFILLTILGGINNTYMFKFNNIKKVIFKDLKYNSDNYKYIYYYELIKNILSTIPFIIIYKYFVKKINLITCILFIFSIKSIINTILLKIFNKYNYLYNEDDPNIIIYIIHILMLSLLFIPFKTLLQIINIVIIIGIITNIYILKYKNYKDLIRLINNIKYDEVEVIKIKNNKIKEYKESNKYLNHIFNKRHKKYLLIYVIRIILISITLIYLYKDNLNNIGTIFTIIYIANLSIKMYELYYIKCDRYLKNNIDLKLYINRILTNIYINIIIPVIINLIIYIKYKTLMFFSISIIITITLILLNTLIYIILKPYKTNKRKIVYSIFHYTVSIILLNVK